MTGYNGYSGDLGTGDKVVSQDELHVIPGSLLGKGITAQAVFNAKFAQPLPPDAPTFYLVPGRQPGHASSGASRPPRLPATRTATPRRRRCSTIRTTASST